MERSDIVIFEDAIERNGILYLISEMGTVNGLKGGMGFFFLSFPLFLLIMGSYV